MQSARGLVPAAAAAAPPACVRRPAQLRSVQVAARRSSRSRHVSLTPCASPDGDKLTSVQRSLETNSQALSESTTTTTTVTSTVTSNAEAVAALNALMEEERRLAALEAQLAEAEKGISANERQMLDLLLQRQALAAAQPDVQEMQSRLRSTEAEAAALRALVTAGRSDVEALVEPVVVSAPVVRTVMDWQDVPWERLSLAQRVGVVYDIVIGKTLDQWRADWAFAKAEGFGLRGLGTVLLAITAFVAFSYALLAGVTGGLGQALGAKPLALPTSTLLVLARVTLSGILVLAEQLCTAIYYTPAAVAGGIAAAVLAYRHRCRTRGEVPFWTEMFQPRPGATEEAVLLRKVPVPLVPPVYYKGISLPAAIQELANQPGAVWPPNIPPPTQRKVPPFTLADDVARLLYGTPTGPRGAAAAGTGMPSSATRLAAAAQQQPEAPPVPSAVPNGSGPGADWRLEPLEGTLSKTQRGVMTKAASTTGSLAGLLSSVAKKAVQTVSGSATVSSSSASSSIKEATAAGGGNEAMAQLRSRFAKMQGNLELGAEQAADDARQRRPLQ